MRSHGNGRARPASIQRGLAAVAILICCATTAAAVEVPAEEETSALDALLGQPVVALFAVVAAGMALGRLRLLGISLGSSGVIFAALAVGARGYALPDGIGTMGLVLFAYCIGISAGPGFFRAFVDQGANLAKLAILLTGAGAATTIAFVCLTGLPMELGAGVFAGAMTSTPALAAAHDVLGDVPAVSIGYGIAYPIGVIAVVLFVQLLPRVLGVNLDEEAKRLDAGANRKHEIQRVLIEVRNPAVIGKRVSEVPFLSASRCLVSRVLWGDRVVPITPETHFEEGQYVLAVGQEDRLPNIIDFLGRRSSKRYFLDIETQRLQVVVTAAGMVGKNLRDLNLLNRFGVTISRLVRNDVTIMPHAGTVVRRADVLFAVGEPDNLTRFSAHAGHRARILDETDIISLSVALVIGMAIGAIPVGLPGGNTFSLGMAGGPLFVGLLLGHFGGIGGIRGHIPRAARILLTEVGLAFFLAQAGVRAGGEFFDVLRTHGAALPIMAVAAAFVPLAVGFIAARRFLKLDILQTLGGICGSMTSTPGLGILSSKTDSEIPTVSYAAVYPVALILMTIFAQVIIGVFS